MVEAVQEIKEISIDLIDDPKLAMRSDVDDDGIDELIASIKAHGLIQPITLRPVSGRYEVIAGHRRFRAHQLGNIPAIKAIVREASEDEVTILKIHENLFRKDVNLVDEACFYGELITRFNYTAERIAEEAGKGMAYVETRLAIFDMPEYMQDHLRFNRYPIGAALWLNKIKNESDKFYYTNYAAQNGCAVGQAQRWCASLNGQIELTPEQREAIAKQGYTPEDSVKYVPCVKCAGMLKLTDAEYVFIHRSCPPKN